MEEPKPMAPEPVKQATKITQSPAKKVNGQMKAQYRAKGLCVIRSLRCTSGDCRTCFIAQQYRIDIRSSLIDEVQASRHRIAELEAEVERLRTCQFMSDEIMDLAEKV
jgi:hypothetical protein